MTTNSSILSRVFKTLDEAWNDLWNCIKSATSSSIETELTPEVTRDNRIEVGFRDVSGNSSSRRDIADESQMITGDENIVDIDFQVVWNISDPAKFLFNLADPTETIRAVSESAMREVIGRSELSPILNRDRA